MATEETSESVVDEYQEPFETEQTEISENEDGSADILSLEDEEEVPAETEHFANLAETMSDDDLSSLSIELMRLVDVDKMTREKRDREYAEALKRMGLDGSDDSDVENGAIIRHPMMIEACIDFAAKVMKELFPASGPVKDHIPGKVTRERADRAMRKKRFVNFQMTRIMREFREELEQAITQLPVIGCQYLKIFWDKKLRRPRAEFVPDDKVLLPYSATSYWSAERKTHVITRTELEMKALVSSGMYREIQLNAPVAPDSTPAEDKGNKIAGIEDGGDNDDGARTLYEMQVTLDAVEDGAEPGEYLPYIVTIDDSTRTIVSIYRNWDEGDETYEALEHMVQFPFIPWRGAHPIGLNHVIGNLNAAATGALRALLDSAHVNNTQTALKLEGGSKGNQTIDIEHGSINTINGSFGTDDIRKVVMPMPFNQPSSTLFQLLDWVTNIGKGVVRTTFEDLADQKTDMPVGTTMALIEQGMTVYSSIHARLHTAMERAVSILHRINRDNLVERKFADDMGEVIVKREDFVGELDVCLVSDPTIFSEVQRQAQTALIAQRSQVLPMMYNLRKVEERILEGARIMNHKELLANMPEPKKLHAVNENVAATVGQAIVVFPDQDHEAHIKTHLAYLQSPLFGGGGHMQPIVTAPMLQHLKDHLAFWYLNKIYDISSMAAGMPSEHLADSDDEDVMKLYDKFMFESSDLFMKNVMGDEFAQSLPPVIQQLVTYVQQMSQAQVQDPKQAAQMAEVQRKTAADQKNVQLKQEDMQQRQQSEAQKLQADQAKHQADLNDRAEERSSKERIAAANNQMEASAQIAEDNRNQVDNETKYRINQEDNQVALEIASAEIQSGEKVAIKNGNSIGE